MDNRIVNYDSQAFKWKMARQLSKLPDHMLSETIVFSARSKRKPIVNELELLKQKINELEKREADVWDLYTELLDQYNGLRSYIFPKKDVKKETKIFENDDDSELIS